MSDTSTPLGSLFETQRTLIDRSIETQEKLNRQGLDLTKQAVTPVVGIAPGDEDDAERRVEDAFDQIEETQADLFADLQEAAERGVDTSEEVTEWSVEFVEKLREAAQDVESDVEDAAEEIDAELEETADDVEVELEETADEIETDVEETAESAAETAEQAAQDAADTVEDVADDGTADASANVVDVDGIGKTYAARLEDAGVETPGDLATTSAADVAEAAGVSEERASEWIQQAQDRA